MEAEDAKNYAEEPHLVAAWQNDGCHASLTRLIKRYRPLIQTQIYKILAGRAISDTHRQDMEQEAIMAFINAVSSFNPEMGSFLARYAQDCVRKSLLRYALDNRYVYRIGTSTAERKAYYAALRARADRIHSGKSEMLRDADIEAIHRTTGAPLKTTRRAIETIYGSQTDVDEVGETIRDETLQDQDLQISLTHVMKELKPFFETLDPREAMILKNFLEDGDASTEDIAERFGLSVTRIGQIRRDMLANMALFLKKKGIEREDVFA